MAARDEFAAHDCKLVLGSKRMDHLGINRVSGAFQARAGLCVHILPVLGRKRDTSRKSDHDYAIILMCLEDLHLTGVPGIQGGEVIADLRPKERERV
jgi:hypothetical protein